MELDGATLAIIVVAIPVVVSSFFDGIAKVVAAFRGEPKSESKSKTDKSEER